MYTIVDERFRRLLEPFELSQLERASGTIYGLWPDLTIAYTNPAWRTFATKNGGGPAICKEWSLGRCVLGAIGEGLRPFFAYNFDRCIAEGRTWTHVYECSSPEHYCEHHMSVYPLRQQAGLLIVNSLVVEVLHTRLATLPSLPTYENSKGLICQCCHCRRVRRGDDNLTWHWVPEWVAKFPEKLTHGICPACLAYHYSPTIGSEQC